MDSLSIENSLKRAQTRPGLQLQTNISITFYVKQFLRKLFLNLSFILKIIVNVQPHTVWIEIHTKIHN